MRRSLTSAPSSGAERRARAGLFIASVVMIAGIAATNYALKAGRVDQILLGSFSLDKLFLVFGGSLGFLGVSMLLMFYLRGDFEYLPDWVGRLFPIFSVFSSRAQFDRLSERAAVKDDLQELSNAVAELRRSQLAVASGEQDVVATLLPLVQAGVGEALEQKFASQAQDFEKLTEIREVFRQANSRLLTELSSLRNRGNLNLVIGTLTTTVAIVLLTYMVLGSARTFSDLTDLLAHYVPRVTIVVFIEIFAFFFLKLYRDTLREMRTYQAELTRMDVQRIALEAAWTDGSQSARRGFAEALLKGEQSAAAKPEPQNEVDLKEVGLLVEKILKSLPSKNS